MDRIMMHTNSHTKILTVLTIDPDMSPGIDVPALDDTHNTFLDSEAL